MKTKNFRKKISIICGDDVLRPVMQHIFFDDGYAIATDAHILLKQSLKENAFTEDEIKIMNGKYLHRNAFDEIYRYDSVSVTENGFVCRKNDVKCLIEFSDIGDSQYPNWQAVVPDTSKLTPVDEIGISVKLLKKVEQVTLSYSKAMRFRFTGKNKGIVILPLDADNFDSGSELILVMPAMIGDAF